MVITVKNHLPIPQHDQSSLREQQEGKAIRPATEAYSLSPFITVGALKNLLHWRHQPARDFMLLHERGDGYPSALYHNDAALADYRVNDGDTLHMTPFHSFPLDVYDATKMEHCFIPLQYVTPAAVDGQFIHLQPSVYCTVYNIKEIIFKLTGYHPDHQLLNPLSTKLHEKDNQTLQSLGFKCSEEIQQITLYNVPPSFHNRVLPSPRLNITFVADSLRVASKRSINPNLTVREMRNNVLVVGDRFWFTFGNTRLEDDKTLLYYNMSNGDAIYMHEC